MKKLIVFLLLSFAITTNYAQVITTAAGNGTSGNGGDGSLAISANLQSPGDVCVDSNGNYYIISGQVIRRVDGTTGNISTIAGNGTAGYNGDGIAATSAQLNYPQGIDVDSYDNLYIADRVNHRIRKVNMVTGVITTVAGTGTSGYTGDSGSAVSANLQFPKDISIDGSGNIYIVQQLGLGHVFRRVDASTGIITTVAGNGQPGFSGDGGPAILAKFSSASASIKIATDNSSNLYIVDGSRIRKVDSSTGFINTIVGTGTVGFGGDSGPATAALISNPQGLELDNSGNLYISDSGNNRIRKVDGSSGIITTIAGNGLSGFSGDGSDATNAKLNVPQGIAVDSYGNKYIADAGNNRIRKVLPCAISVDPLSINTQTVCQNSSINPLNVTATSSGTLAYQWYSNTINSNSGGALISGATSSSYVPPSTSVGVKYYYVDVSVNCAVITSSVSGAITVNAPAVITGQPSPTSQTVCQNGTTTALTVSAAGVNLNYQWYSNTTNNNSGGSQIIGAEATSYTPSSSSSGIKYYYVTVSGDCGSPETSLVVSVSSTISTSITVQPLAGMQVSQGGIAAALSVTGVGSSLSYQWFSNLINSNSGGVSIIGASASSYTPPTLNIGTTYYYVTVSGLCGSDISSTSSITVIGSEIITTIAGNGTSGNGGDGGLATSANLQSPGFVCVDSNGNYYIISDQVIRRVDGTTNNITTVAGTGTAGYNGDGVSATSAQLNYPQGIDVDSFGNLYIADRYNHRIRKIDITTGIITTVAGTGTGGYSGDAGLAISASILSPKDLSIDGSNNMYFVQEAGLGHVFRKINASTGIITTVAGNGMPGFSGDGGPATLAKFSSVSQTIRIGTDNSGNLYIADFNRIRKVDSSTGFINTVVGNGSAGYSGDGSLATAAVISSPQGLATDNSGNFYISDTGNNRIRKVDISTGIITTVAGNGLSGFSGDGSEAIYAKLNGPQGIAVDSYDNKYIADVGNNRIRKVLPCIYSVSSPSTVAQTVCQNSSVNPLSATATGSGTLAYQWYSNTTNTNSGGALISGATGTSYAPPSTTVGTIYYYAVVQGSCGSVISSVSGAITVNGLTVISSQPSSTGQTVCQDGTVTVLAVTATGTNLNYQWNSNATNSNSGGSPISGATAASYTPPSSSAGTKYYYVIVSGDCGASVTSSVSGAIVVNASTAISIQPSPTGQTVCQDGTVSPLAVTAAGTNLTYQWYSNTTSSNSGGSPISGATAASYTPSSTSVGTKYYYVIVSGDCGTGVTSSVSGAIIVNGTTAISSQPSPTGQTVCQDGTVTPLTVTATGTNLTYQWYSNTTSSNSGGSPISGATAASYTPPSTAVGTKYYYVIVSGDCGASVTSSVSGAIIVNGTTAISNQPSPTGQTVCQNGTVTPLTVTATGTNLTYQWYSNTTSSNSGGSPISGATAASYTPPSTAVGTKYYYVIVSGDCGASVTSSVSGAIIVNGTTAISSQPSPTGQTVCQNGTVTPLTVTATGTNLTYQWYSNTTNSNSGGTLKNGATAASYTPPSSTAGTKYYYVIVSGDCGASVTSSVSGAIIVNGTTAISSQPSPAGQTVCQNGAVTPLTVTATGTNLTYQWYSNTTNSNSGGTLKNGATAASYTPPSTAVGTKYYYVIVSGNCGASVTSSVSGAIIVNGPTAIISQPSSAGQTVCQNGAVTPLAVTATGTNLTYQWYSNTTNSNSGGTLKSGATAASYTPPSTTVGTKYYYVIVGGSCGASVTSSVSGAILVGYAGGSISQSGNFCVDGQVTLTAGSGTNYIWSLLAGGIVGSGISKTFFQPGNYRVDYNDIYGCSVSASKEVNTCGGGGRQASDNGEPEIQTPIGFGIFPNPASEEVMVSLADVAETDCSVDILDINGMKLFSDYINKGSQSKSFNLEGVASGVYIIQVKNNSAYRYAKLIVKR